MVGAAGAKDWSEAWKFHLLLQPEYRFDPRTDPNFRWHRVRGILTGPISSRAYGKIQVDRTIGKLRFFDLFASYNAVKGPVSLNLTGGLFFPAFAKDGWELPKGIDYAYVTEALALQFRQGGAQATVGFGPHYQVAAGVFNGAQTLLNDPNDRPLYLLSASAMQSRYKARVWGMTGYDGTTAAQSKTWMAGVEATDIKAGRLFAEAAGMAGSRFGRQVYGVYGDLGYKLDGNSSFFVRGEWCDRNSKVPGNARQRYTLSLQHRVTRHCVAKWDTQFQADNGDVRGMGQLDIFF